MTRFAPDLPTTLLGDPLRLNQVLTNLVGNALKFTEHGEVVVTIERDTQSRDPGALRFSVSDTGIGIKPEKLTSIFSPFAQADSSTTRKYGGSGLGLAIVERLVQLMGGRVWVQSEVGKGSTFISPPASACRRAHRGASGAAHGPGRSAGAHHRSQRHLPRRRARDFRRPRRRRGRSRFGRTGRLAVEQANRAAAPFQLVFADCSRPDAGASNSCAASGRARARRRA